MNAISFSNTRSVSALSVESLQIIFTNREVHKMSQAKVEKHKQEKYNRKNAPKKSNFKKYLAYACTTIVAIAIIWYVGYSVGVETGLIKPEETTSAYVSSVTPEELASKLESSGDSLGFYNKAKASESDTDASEEEATTVEETTK